jgi:hypothetical protein
MQGTKGAARPSESFEEKCEMKPLQIGLLVVVGAVGGALIMKFTQSSQPVAAPITNAAPAPAAAPAVQPAAAAPENAEAPAEPVKPAPMPPAAKPVKVVHVSRPVKPRPAVTRVAQNRPPTFPETLPQPAPQPAPQPQPVAPETVQPAPAAEPAPLPEPVAPAPAAPQPPPAPSVTLPAGLLISARLGEALSSEHNESGDTFTATLEAPVAAGGYVIAERGARVEGRVVEAYKAGHVRGTGALALELTKLYTSDGQRVAIRTDTFRKQAASSTREDAEKIAAVAGIGAAIGALAGGGKGAAIGAAAGGAAGAGGAIATRHSVAALAPETRISFRLREPVTLTERMSQ